MQNRITALILTANENKHIIRCLRSLEGVVDQIVIVDSGSTDNTAELCREFGAEVYYNPWRNYSSQFNWGLDHGGVRGNWCLRIDADEYLSEELRESIRQLVVEGDIEKDIAGFYVKRIMVFMGRAIRHGGCGNLYMLRLFRYGQGRCEERWMDEHITLSCGNPQRLPGELVDENLNNIGWWILKHNNYATREAIDLLNIRYGFEPHMFKVLIDEKSQAGRKRWLKENVYSRLPTGLRAALYFSWRYLGQLGFLDGKAGLIFHFLQGFWYRFLVDIKVDELEERSAATGALIEQVIEDEYGFRVGSRRS
jgi:glycosyltransferase involved in cell wall biosynthesis